MMRLGAFFAVLLAAAPAVAQSERPVECLLFIDGQEYIRGTCMFSPIGGDGSFQISAMNGSVFAQVLISKPGVADGYWNGGNYGGHAHSPLGVLQRDDACWVNADASVCAW